VEKIRLEALSAKNCKGCFKATAITVNIKNFEKIERDDVHFVGNTF
jgi:hypothetical protein